MLSDVAPRSQSLRQLSLRLTSACALTEEMRHGLLQGEEQRIEAATARLQTVAAECRLLADELRRGSVRLEQGAGDLVQLGTAARALDAEESEAHLEFEKVATELARQSAIHGGLLVGLVRLTQRLLDTLAEARGEAYSRSGHARAVALEGLRLEERA